MLMNIVSQMQMKDLWHAVAKANKKTVLSVLHLKSSWLSVGLSPPDAKGRPQDNNTKWKFHCGIVLRWTALAKRIPHKSLLTLGSMAGSYFQWRSTEVTDVRWEITIDVAVLSLNNSTK